MKIVRFLKYNFFGIAVLTILFAVAFGTVYGYLNEVKEVSDLTSKGVETVGVVDSIDNNTESGTIYFVKFRTYDNSVIHTFNKNRNDDIIPLYAIGDSVHVLYLKETPFDARIKSDKELYERMQEDVFSLIVRLLLFVTCIVFYKPINRKLLDFFSNPRFED